MNISLFSDNLQPGIDASDPIPSLDGAEVKAAAGRPRAVLISGYHDYRTSKRGSIHRIADGLLQAGLDVSFISTRFSTLTRWTDDSRLFLWDRANIVEIENGIECLLWRTLVHPFSSRIPLLQSVSGHFYDWYSELPNEAFDRLVRDADYVVAESGAAAIYLRRIRRLNPRGKVIYYGADRLETINAHPRIRERLENNQACVDHFSIRATGLKEDFPYAVGRLYKSGFGITEDEYSQLGPSPYAAGEKAAVSVGSMLFDCSVFQLVAAHFPEVQFHVIGCGANFEAPPNVHIHPEMSFERTLAFVKHAAIGIAAYAPATGSEYLAESSLKLAQFEYFGLPAVCPRFATGSSPSRFGYDPGNEGSMKGAVAAALSKTGLVQSRTFPSWVEVALQVIEPVRYGAEPIG